MKIAIDISQVVYGTGVSRYTDSLVSALLKTDQKNQYTLFSGALRRRRDILKSFPNSKVFPIPPKMSDFLWNRLHILPIEKLIGKVDVLHTSDWAEPPSKAFKVTTVHDMYAFKFPKLVDPGVLEAHKRKIYWVAKESKRIITPSISTKNDLMELGFDEDIIRVIPEAPYWERASQEKIVQVRKKYHLRKDYLISVGITPLKNTKRIIKAFRLGTVGKDLKLVLVGRPTNIKVEPERNVRMLGHVPSEDLAALISGSQGLIFASLYEGYGIPILDGFNCHVPVVTSNVASMPEVAGDAAALVDPESVESIAEGIEKIVRGPKSYIDKGIKRVKDFSWEKTAKMTLDVYNEAQE